MKKRVGIYRGAIILVVTMFLTIPLLGWNAFPWNMHPVIPGDGQIPEAAEQKNAPAKVPSPGNIQRGQDLFMGYTDFQNDGPPCMGCHNVGRNGLLGGGAMGPDLTDVSTRRSQAEIASILANGGPTVSPVMQPIFAEHPLTESEQTDLIAFLNASSGQPESNRETLVIGISLAGFAAAVILLGFVYRGRLRGVRKALVREANSR